MTEEEFRSGKGPLFESSLHGISEAYADVFRFHKTFNHPYSKTPVMQPVDRVVARADWITEEVEELCEAETIYDQADAYLDIMYFAVGGLVEMGINPAHIWPLVQAANMAKVWPDGSVQRRADGKIMKPPGWTSPDQAIADAINRLIEGPSMPLLEPHSGEMSDMIDKIASVGSAKTNIGDCEGMDC